MFGVGGDEVEIRGVGGKGGDCVMGDFDLNGLGWGGEKNKWWGGG